MSLLGLLLFACDYSLHSRLVRPKKTSKQRWQTVLQHNHLSPVTVVLLSILSSFNVANMASDFGIAQLFRHAATNRVQNAFARKYYFGSCGGESYPQSGSGCLPQQELQVESQAVI